MSSFIPSLFLLTMIALTLVLLPRLNDEQQRRTDEPQRATEEIHIKPKLRK